MVDDKPKKAWWNPRNWRWKEGETWFEIRGRLFFRANWFQIEIIMEEEPSNKLRFEIDILGNTPQIRFRRLIILVLLIAGGLSWEFWDTLT